MSNRSVPPNAKKPITSNARAGVDTLRPAFASNITAFCFLALVAFALALPFLITETGLITRRDSYGIMPEKSQPYSFLENEVFDNKEDIDLLFLGSSIMWTAIDTPQVQKALSDSLGRPARVITFGHSFNSIDTSYMQLRDVLEQKRVRMVVFSVPRIPYTDSPSMTGCKFLRYNENRDVVDKLSLKYRASLYACGILRSPHDLLTLIRKNRSSLTPYTADLGALRVELGWGANPATFEKFNPPPPSIPANNLIYSPDTREQYEFINDEITLYQYHYIQKLAEMLESRQIPLIMVNIPQHSERHNTKIIERRNWSESLNMDIPLVGIPPATLFAGLSDEEIKRLYYDEHTNVNGSEFFTRAVLPAILKIYDEHAAKN